MTAEPMTITVDHDTAVSALLLRPEGARLLYVLGHGAGAGMRHAFMEDMAGRLAARGVATLRYQFPYMEAGRRFPDRHPVLEATVRAAVDTARDRAPSLPVLAGGKSMGGRMTSQAQANGRLEGVLGLAFLGFPLHPARAPGTERAEHLGAVELPMLFVQGTRDRLAELELLGPVLDGLGERATLHAVEGADHGFAVLKRSGRDPDAVLDEVAGAVADWGTELIRPDPVG